VRGALAEGKHRRVDLVPDLRGREELSHEWRVTVVDRVAKRFQILAELHAVKTNATRD
jgi:hypothetical protein